MRNGVASLGHVNFLVGLVLGLTGCATSVPKPMPSMQEASVAQPADLRLKGEPGREEKVKYYSKTVSAAYEEGDIRHRKEEVVEFTAKAVTTAVDSEKNFYTQALTVTEKDGFVDLHDFAMPEVDERLEIVYTTRGDILKAGTYPSNSIFYVPSISLPLNPVEVGDTWSYKGNWVSLSEGIPFQLEMVTILKGFWKCGKDDECADLEISGDVRVQGELVNVLGFESHWQGRALLARKAGTVIWSRVRSTETFRAGDASRESQSCLEAILVEPADLKLDKITSPACDPQTPVYEAVPGLAKPD